MGDEIIDLEISCIIVVIVSFLPPSFRDDVVVGFFVVSTPIIYVVPIPDTFSCMDSSILVYSSSGNIAYSVHI